MNLHGNLKGKTTWELVNPDGTIAQSSREANGLILPDSMGENSNLILDQGLNNFFAEFSQEMRIFRDRLVIGTSNTVPNASQIGLGAQIGGSSASDGGFTSEESFSVVAVPASNVWRYTGTIVRVITVGSNVNIAEYGLAGHPTFTDGSLSIRELTRNNLGNPVVISALAGQTFKLKHTLIVELPYNPVAASFTISGASGGLQSGTATWYSPASDFTIFQTWLSYYGGAIRPLANTSSTSPIVAPDTTFGTVNGSVLPYVAGSFEAIKRYVIPPSALVGNHGGWEFRSNLGNGGYKFIRSSGNYVKSNSVQLTMDARVSWSRAP